MKISSEKDFKLKETLSFRSSYDITRTENNFDEEFDKQSESPAEHSNKKNYNIIKETQSECIKTDACTCTPSEAQTPAEKSSLILIAIVLLFTLTHCYRLALKAYEVFMPHGNTYKNFKRCLSFGR